MSTGDEITIPLEFSGEGQLLLYTRYGDPGTAGWENKWLTEWKVQDDFSWYPIPQLTIHKHFKPILQKALAALERANLHTDIREAGVCYEVRCIKGSESVLSVHSWGAAVDFNMAENPLGSRGRWSDEFLNVMEANEICCGQRWSGRKDPAHFSMVNG